MPASLNCPTCGAPASGADADRCDYCGSALTTVACPSCFAAMFAGMDYCPHCGARAERTIDEAAAGLACPGCHGDMQSIMIGDTPMRECRACSSQFIEAEVFTRLCTTREARGAVVAFADLTPATGTAPTQSVAKAVHYVVCPICTKTMNRQNFGRRSGVVIDVCKGHGAWFERGELCAALAFIDSGGFERARLDEEQRKFDERAKLINEFEKSGRMERQLDLTMRLHPSMRPTDTFLDDALRRLLF